MQDVVLGVSVSRKQQGCKQRDKYCFGFFLFFAIMWLQLCSGLYLKSKSGNMEPLNLNFEDETTLLAHCEWLNLSVKSMLQLNHFLCQLWRTENDRMSVCSHFFTHHIHHQVTGVTSTTVSTAVSPNKLVQLVQILSAWRVRAHRKDPTGRLISWNDANRCTHTAGTRDQQSLHPPCCCCCCDD